MPMVFVKYFLPFSLTFIIGASFGWFVQKLETTRVFQAAEQARLTAAGVAREQEQKLLVEAYKAQEEKARELEKLEIELDGLRTSGSRLRDTIAHLRAGSGKYSTEAAIKYSDTALKLLDDCQTRYSALAERADKHIADLKEARK